MKKITFLLFFGIILIHVSAQNIGIGTTIPNTSALLHIDLEASTTKGLLATGTYNATSIVPDLGAGTRLMFYPGKGAFRAGYVSGNQWNNVNVGLLSTATGFNTTASGNTSIAMGSNTYAGGSYSTALGDGTMAKGYSTIAMGVFNDPVLATDETSINSATPLLIVGNGNDDISRSNALLVRKNGDVEVENLMIGGGNVISKQQSGTATVGPNASAFKTFTLTFPQSFTSVPKIIATARSQAATDYPDTFVVTLRSVSTTAATFNIVRIDQNTLWAQDLQMDWMAWE